MPNSKENVVTRHLHGKFGNQVVFKTRNGNSYSADVPKAVMTKPGDVQVAIRDKFKLATLWAKGVLADPVELAEYQAAAKNGQTAFQLALTDFLRPPRISSIDGSGYNGHTGEKILVVAFDDFKIKEVKVTIKDPAGVLIEKGVCQLDVKNVYWEYTATTEVANLAGVTITARATDYPQHYVEVTMTLQ